MTVPLATDIEIELARSFAAESLSEVSRMLARYQGPERDRVIRCILSLAGADPQRIAHLVAAAAQDYRDVIYWAEYDTSDRRVRDCNEPVDRR